MEKQIAKSIFLKSLDSMKKILDLTEYGMDMRTKQFQYAKSNIMEITYENLTKLFKELSDAKIIKKCSCDHSLRKGYSSCICGGSGWVNAEDTK